MAFSLVAEEVRLNILLGSYFADELVVSLLETQFFFPSLPIEVYIYISVSYLFDQKSENLSVSRTLEIYARKKAKKRYNALQNL